MSHFVPVQLFGTITDSLIHWLLPFGNQLNSVELNGKREISILFSWIQLLVEKKTFTAPCKVVIFLDFSVPAVLDCTWMFYIYAFNFHVFCIPHLSTRVCFPTLQP